MGKMKITKKQWINVVVGVLFLLLLVFFIITIVSGRSRGGNAAKDSNTYKNDQIVEKKYAAEAPDYEEWERKTSTTRAVRYEKNGDYYTYTTPTTPNTARIMCAGDLMCEPGMSKPVFQNDKFFFEYCFQNVRKVFDASDFAIANLETCVDPDAPYALDKHKIGDRYHCNAPEEFLDALRYAGLDGVVMANNHSCDTGALGLNHTINNVEDHGLLHTGAFNSADDKRYFIVDINGIRVAFFSYAQHYNGKLDEKFFTEEGKEVMLNEYSQEKVKKDLIDARQDGAEFTIVYIHFYCKDYPDEVSERQIETAREIAEAGADCIIGGHPHLAQPYDEIVLSSGRRVPVVYSLGNFITSDGPVSRLNYIYELFLEKDASGEVRIADEMIIPCKVVVGEEKSEYVVFPTPKNWRNGKDNEMLQEAEDEILLRVGDKIRVDTNED